MARTFNGSSQYATVASGLGLGADTARWVSLWGYKDNSTTNCCYFSMGISGSANNRMFISGSTTMSATTTNNIGVGAAATTGSAPSNATWFHLLAEFGGAATRKITLNGGTTATNTTSNSLGSAPSLTRIGGTPTPSALMLGRIAYVAVYSGVPTAAEIGYLSGGGTPANAFAPNLVATDRLLAYWPLDGNASPEPDDFGSNDMTLTGSPSQSTSPAIQLSGNPYPSGATLANWWWS